MRAVCPKAWIPVLLAIVLAACSSSPKKNLALEQVRAQLEELKSNSELADYAPLALGEAERALRAAETASGSDTEQIHLTYMADRRIQIARTVAQREHLQVELKALGEEHNHLLLRASQLEAERARREADRARMMSQATAEDAERARVEAGEAQKGSSFSQDGAAGARGS